MHILLSNERLRRVLGGLWLLDGLLQLQPGMFTLNLVQNVGVSVPFQDCSVKSWEKEYPPSELASDKGCIAGGSERISSDLLYAGGRGEVAWGRIMGISLSSTSSTS
jgi:hypothetical protein